MDAGAGSSEFDRTDSAMLTLLAIWLAVCIALMLIGHGGRLHSAGMPLAYFLGLSLIHTPGAAVYIDFPKWDELAIRTEAGFEETVTGMVAFLIGVMIVRSIATHKSASRIPKFWPPSQLAALDRLALLYLFGGICYFFLGSFVAIPSVGAAIAALASLLVVGSSLRLWVARQEKNSTKLWLSISLLPLLPLITVIRGGFIGFGTYWLLSIVSFSYAQSKQRLGYFLIAPILVFVGLSVFVNYMASRTAFRQAAWFQQVSIEERFDRVLDIFRNFEWYDSASTKQREVIDGRLNQNLLVGAASERLKLGAVNYANGATLVNMAIGLIPRALWPGKPQVGGGGTVVEDFTGIRFAEGTSVGAGQVLEFYINFGTWGVIGGFLLYGSLIGWMDLRIMERLEQGDQTGFLLWFTVCLALLQPGGNLLEVVVSAAGSAITSLTLGYFLKRRFDINSTPDATNSQLTVT